MVIVLPERNVTSKHPPSSEPPPALCSETACTLNQTICGFRPFNALCVFVFWPYWAVLRGYFWLYPQGSLLGVQREPYGRLRTKPGTVACKANSDLQMLFFSWTGQKTLGQLAIWGKAGRRAKGSRVKLVGTGLALRNFSKSTG